MRMVAALIVATVLFATGHVSAQQPAAPTSPLDVVPDRMAFSNPYGAPITLQRAEAAIQAAIAEANKRGWPESIAVVDSGGNLIAFSHMDGAFLASTVVAQHKARAAAEFRRPTKVFEDALQKSDLKIILTLDGVIAARGGIPLIEDDKIIGAIGCSGGAASQDEVVCTVGAATINK